MFILHVQLPDHSEREVTLPSGELVLLGRSKNATIRLDDPSMSRIHCRLLARGGRVVLTDAGSRWGTLLNGESVSEAELRPGDEITLGETIVTLKTRGRSEATTVAPSVDRAKDAPKKKRTRIKEQDVHFDTATASAFDSAILAEAVFEDDDEEPILLEDAEVDSPKEPEPAAKKQRKAQFKPQFHATKFVGKRFVRYDVKELLCDARTGLVFLARDANAGRDVALKLFRPEVLDEPRTRQRFLRGVRTMMPLQHDNLVRVHAAGRLNGICYTASEYVDGESATGMIRRIGISGMLDPGHVLRIGMQIARALEFAEEHQVVHRNITPQNILIRKSDGLVKLGDLQFAKALEGAEEKITRAGELVGEIAWMSPEAAGSGDPLDCRSDLYSFGAVLYALLTGRPPFEGRSPAHTLEMILQETPIKPTVRHLAVPALLEGVVLHLLEKRPDDRPQSAREVVRDLERVAKYENIKIV